MAGTAVIRDAIFVQQLQGQEQGQGQGQEQERPQGQEQEHGKKREQRQGYKQEDQEHEQELDEHHHYKQKLTIDIIIQLPELALAIQTFLGPKHLFSTCLVSKYWASIWTPFLWQTLILLQPHPALHSKLIRKSNSSTVNSKTTDNNKGNGNSRCSLDSANGEERYVLTEACLSRYGHYVRCLNASWLTPQSLLRLSYFCLNLQHVKLADTLIPIKRVLQPMLRSLGSLRKLELDLPFEFIDEEEEEEEDCQKAGEGENGRYEKHEERKLKEEEEERVLHLEPVIAKGPHENSLLKSIEVCASTMSLEYLSLIFQTSVRVPVMALLSLFRRHRKLHTVKLVDADIEELVFLAATRKSTGKGKGNPKRKNGKGESESNMSRSGSGSGLGPQPAFASTSVVGTPSLPQQTQSPVSISGSDDENTSIASTSTPGSPCLASSTLDTDIYNLLFLSIISSHTSDTALAHILERCPHLQALHLHSCDNLSDTSLELIAQQSSSLTSISLSSCKKMTVQGLKQFFMTTHRLLIHIHLCDMTAVHDETLELIAQRHSLSLRKLAIYFCAFVKDKGIKTLLKSCKELEVLGLQAYGMSTEIFEEPWACEQTLEQLDLQAVFKLFVQRPENDDGNNNSGNANVKLSDFSATRVWRDRQARIDAFEMTRRRLMTLSNLRNLRLFAGGIGEQVLNGFGVHQRIEVLHLYGLQSTIIHSLPWSQIRMRYPYLKQFYCGVIGTKDHFIRDELERLNVELLTSSSIPDLAFENNFDD
ncbi:hypothetical protein BX616_004605 [Lobosporangium transversale]|uniref:F-box domain-containing protein n=1 Tax=Lobosporangium transversale TaxID=64571 RepID=A0A1Y2GJD4_9FUNG|nr:hypothetical protein BCR41DRAFT_424294 [Lobosporangium transversale]KAF9898017.1 hypothetical protein BX616_004605 [Lobosporangium transversale]ORZ09101.1 hypothetical protein BCR41DRAFT_424294 [Lobosporangium transversale]|eukprot:XP_021878728.1 hypothetical protein BCR41DRAFT_424294 [Lobosporangium transversale]